MRARRKRLPRLNPWHPGRRCHALPLSLLSTAWNDAVCIFLSDIPLSKPVAGVRVGLLDGQFVVNPTIQQQQESSLDLVIAGTEDAVLMIEGFCDFLTEDQMLEVNLLAVAARSLYELLGAGGWNCKESGPSAANHSVWGLVVPRAESGSRKG